MPVGQVHFARQAIGPERSLRHAKRYRVVNSPISAMNWWRIILDEAQNVGGGFSQVGPCALSHRFPAAVI
jgi:E3 ubiquitin-protein ligase SHPRH